MKLTNIALLLILVALACFGAYHLVPAEIDQDGILHEPFALLPIGWTLLFVASVLWMVGRRKERRDGQE